MVLDKEQARNVQYYIFGKGHSEPSFDGDYIIYRDQTPGQLAQYVRVPVEPILDLVDGLSLKLIDKVLGKKSEIESYLEIYKD